MSLELRWLAIWLADAREGVRTKARLINHGWSP
jgi:hypothetical protein